MNEVLNFFKDVISGENTNSRPVGLTSFKHETCKKEVITKPKEKKEVSISELMRRPH